MPTPLTFHSDHYAVVSAMITPAFFLTATASLLVASNNRLARVVDRMRTQISELQKATGTEMSQLLESNIRRHQQRARLVLTALQLLYGAISAFVCTSLAIAADQFAGYRLGALPTGLAVLGVLLVLVASINLGREARISVSMLNEQLVRALAKDVRQSPPD